MVSQKARKGKLSEIGKLVNPNNIPKPTLAPSSNIRITTSFSESEDKIGLTQENSKYFQIAFRESHEEKYRIPSIHKRGVSDENKVKMKAAIVDFMEETVGKKITWVNNSGFRRKDDEWDTYIDHNNTTHDIIHFGCYHKNNQKPHKRCKAIRLHGYYIGDTFMVLYVDWFHDRHANKNKR